MKVVIDGVEYVPTRNKKPVEMHKLFADARYMAGKTLRQASAETGLSINTFYNAECGNIITLKNAVRICRYYGISLEDLGDSVELMLKEKEK